MNKKPVLIEIKETTSVPEPDSAPPVPDMVPPPEGQAMQGVVAMANYTPSRLGRLFWGLVLILFGALLSVSAWNFITDLMIRAPLIGYAITGLTIALLLVLLIIALREVAAFSRLKRLDALQHDAQTALADNDLVKAQMIIKRLNRLYSHREETRWGRERLAEYGPEQFDASALLGLAETELLTPLDVAAQQEVQIAARQVATITALVPLAMADVIAALTANLRMIRRIADIYGGRSGVLGSWRLARAVMAHLIATGAVAIGDDMLEPLLGGGLLKKLSRRFGEGLVNGALTARVGLAAMEVCRPLPFARKKRPSVSAVIRASLGQLFTGKANTGG